MSLKLSPPQTLTIRNMWNSPERLNTGFTNLVLLFVTSHRHSLGSQPAKYDYLLVKHVEYGTGHESVPVAARLR